jgi:hypothetical protein
LRGEQPEKGMGVEVTGDQGGDGRGEREEEWIK